jgi:hypothetical protein
MMFAESGRRLNCGLCFVWPQALVMSVLLASMEYLTSENATTAETFSDTAHDTLTNLVAVEDEMFVGRSVYHSAISSSVNEV